MDRIAAMRWTALVCLIAACGTAKAVDDGSGGATNDVQVGSDIQFVKKDGSGLEGILQDGFSGADGSSDSGPDSADTPSDTTDGSDGGDGDATDSDVNGSDTTADDGDAAGSDTATTTGCEFAKNPSAGEPGATCKANADCDSGYCVDSANGKICSQTCSSCCPTGFHCGQITGSSDTSYICLAQFIALCRPCNTDAECGTINAGALCVSAGDGGSFCGGACDKDADCPGGYGCKAAQGEKGAGQQCVRLSGECSCSQKAIFDGAATNCTSANSFGSCGGTRKCALAGLTACSATTPAQEICNGKDDNCDGLTDGGDSADCVTYWKDGDGDGAGVGAGQCLCAAVGLATATTNGDCDDDAKAVHPGAKEICNDVDDNCDGTIDEGCDDDGDGYCDAAMVIVGAPVVCKFGNKDCNDTAASVHPNAPEICGNGVDDDCNGVTDDNASTTFYLDADSDGFGNAKVTQQACAKPVGYVTVAGDCDDNSGTVHPGAAEVCDGVDNDCDGVTDGVGLTGCTAFFADNDGDGAGTGASTCLCKPTDAFTALSGGDCDDANAAIHPGAPEACNSIDDNCNGLTDEENASGCTLFYPDSDGDTYGAIVTGHCLCAADGVNKSSKSGDCNDDVASIHPKADETCNGIDDNCDGVIDPANSEGCSNFYLDGDGDGFGVTNGGSKCLCTASGAYSALVTGDCDDASKATFPGATEVCNGADDNCNGQVDEGVQLLFFVDADKDGYGAAALSVPACTAPPGYVADNTDCDGSKASVHPGATEVCNGIDDNCDGVIDPANSSGCTAFYADADKDGFGSNAAGQCLCAAAAPFTAAGQGDCDDGSAAIHPGATELCNGLDDNCNGVIDEGVGGTYYRDLDGDLYGDPATTAQGCTAPSGYVGNSTDCDDAHSYVHPGAPELCNGLDDNCNGQIDEGVLLTWYRDSDGDGFGTANITQQACTQPVNFVSNSLDCNDASAAINPNAAEVCNGVDDNCNGQTDELLPTTTYYLDNDVDGYGTTSKAACKLPAGYATLGGDCNDTPVSGAAIHPGAAEICNGIDDDCNNQTDESSVFTTYYQDSDGDGYGNPGKSVYACSKPAGYITVAGDCLDTNASVPGPTELCGASNAPNGIDENCNGTTDEGCTAVTCSTSVIQDFTDTSGAHGWTLGNGWTTSKSGGEYNAPWTIAYSNDPSSGYKTGGGTASKLINIQAGTKYAQMDVSAFWNIADNSCSSYGSGCTPDTSKFDSTVQISISVNGGTAVAVGPFSADKYGSSTFTAKAPMPANWAGGTATIALTVSGAQYNTCIVAGIAVSKIEGVCN